MSEKKKIKVNAGSEEVSDKLESKNEFEEKSKPNQSAKEKPDEGTPNDPLAELEAKLQSKEVEAQENYDRLLRISAEFENYKKRSAREMEDFRKFANQALLKEMLSVVDNLELALGSAKEDQTTDNPLIEGLNLTHKEILRVLEKFSVKPIAATGEPFDPTYHEAVMQEETDEFPENTIINELQRGYLIHDRLLRPAMVVVAKPKQKRPD